MAATRNQLELVVNSAVTAADDISIFELCHPFGADLPAFEAGANLSFELNNGIVRQYSIASDPRDRQRYVVAVKRQISSRGGSMAMHSLGKGSRVTVSGPQNSFPLADFDGEHILLSGGIGITPLLSMAHELDRRSTPFKLIHFVSRNSQLNAFDELLDPLWSTHVEKYSSENDLPTAERLRRLAEETASRAAIYICGPAGFIQCADSLFAPVVGRENIFVEHFERTGVNTGSAFTVDVVGRSSGVRVAEGQTILEALRSEGIDIMTSCAMGVCGTCITEVLSGIVDHRDDYLSDKEKAEGRWVIPCVSRCMSSKLTLKVNG